ncbi:uncharacterized protein LOC117115203 [Anneissia japonica]|uniref:uncharacterized protein LOC117115203 n=1 Tax=Anneissia japonica TaxID=1529436 RepID=UPI0014259490|nr:uncharacterized protein LOC117115203 [Anneissia japonica]
MTYLSTRLDGAAPHMLQREAWVIVQRESFADELSALTSGKNVDRTSRINMLDPIIDEDTGLMEQKTPVILEPNHPITKLIIKKTDENLHHPGSERVLAELRRRVWILRGREVIRGIQRQCQSCQKWRAKTIVPKMNDLPPERLRLNKPVFYSTGVDCFGPIRINVGRRIEKRWGIVYKCLTVGAKHLELLDSMDAEAFLLYFRRLIS